MLFTVQQKIFVLMYTYKLFTLVFDIQKDNCELNHLKGALISSGSIKEHVAPIKKTIADTPSYISSGINQPICPANSGLSYSYSITSCYVQFRKIVKKYLFSCIPVNFLHWFLTFKRIIVN
jgi:hypothetical protein